MRWEFLFAQLKGPCNTAWCGDPDPENEKPRNEAWVESPYHNSRGHTAECGLGVDVRNSRSQAERGLRVRIPKSSGYTT